MSISVSNKQKGFQLSFLDSTALPPQSISGAMPHALQVQIVLYMVMETYMLENNL